MCLRIIFFKYLKRFFLLISYRNDLSFHIYNLKYIFLYFYCPGYLVQEVVPQYFLGINKI